MTRKLRIYNLPLILFLLFVSSASATELYKVEVRESHPGGKSLEIAFQEERRDEKTSTAKVTFASGASIPSIMFIARGFYEIAKERGSAYFVKLREWKAADGSWMYEVGYFDDPDLNLVKYFELSSSVPKITEKEIFSVRDFDRVFRREN